MKLARLLTFFLLFSFSHFTSYSYTVRDDVELTTVTISGLSYDILSDRSDCSLANPITAQTVDIPRTILYAGSTRTVTSIGNCIGNGRYVSRITIPSTIKYCGGHSLNFATNDFVIEDSPSRILLNWEIVYQDESLMKGPLETNIKRRLYVGRDVINNEDKQKCFLFSSIRAKEIELGGYKSSVLPGEFYGNGNLKTLIIGGKVATIGRRGFANCDSLTDIRFSSKLSTVDTAAFENCTMATKVVIDDLANWCGVDFKTPTSNPINYSHTIYNGNLPVYRLVIPNGVKKINKYAFVNGTVFKRVVIPSTVEEIEDLAFDGCSGLKKVIVNATTPPTANYDAFRGVSRSKCYLVVPKGCKDIYNGWCGFYNIDDNENTHHYYFRVYVDGLSYGKEDEDDSGVDVTFGSPEMPSEGNSSYVGFNGCVEIPSTIIYESITYPVTTVGARAFYNTKISCVVIPESVEYIDAEAFTGTGTTLRSVTCLAPMPPVCASEFDEATYSGTLYVPEGCGEVYRNTLPWSRFSQIVEGRDPNGAHIEPIYTADAESGVVVTAEGGRICAEGAAEDAVMEVYDAAGRMVHRGGHRTEPLVSGVYIVRIGSTVTKVRL